MSLRLHLSVIAWLLLNVLVDIAEGLLCLYVLETLRKCQSNFSWHYMTSCELVFVELQEVTFLHKQGWVGNKSFPVQSQRFETISIRLPVLFVCLHGQGVTHVVHALCYSRNVSFF